MVIFHGQLLVITRCKSTRNIQKWGIDKGKKHGIWKWAENLLVHHQAIGLPEVFSPWEIPSKILLMYSKVVSKPRWLVVLYINLPWTIYVILYIYICNIYIYIYNQLVGLFTIYLPYTIEFTKFTMSDWDIKKPCRSKLLQTIDFTIKTWEFQDPKVEVLEYHILGKIGGISP